jgi:hypothetical protein
MDSTNSNGHKTSGETVNEELLEAIDAAIRSMQAQLKDGAGVKGALTDFIRLLQLRKDLEGDRPRHVSARWIEECQNSRD